MNVLSTRKVIRELFTNLTENFHKENVEYWTDFGTLLGVKRDSDIIIGDNDADICIINTPENIEKCKKVVDKMGGEYLDWGAFRVYQTSLVKKIFVDIYIPEIINNQYKNPTGELIDVNMIHPIEKKSFKLGNNTIDIYVPQKIDLVLDNRYGKNWKIQKRKWYTFYFDFSKDFNFLSVKI